MSRKAQARLIAALMLVFAMPAFTQRTAAAKKAEEKMTFESLTPNLIVSDIDRSAAFYRDVLGFQQTITVPEKPPFVFVWLKHGSVDVFLEAFETATPVTGSGIAQVICIACFVP